MKISIEKFEKWLKWLQFFIPGGLAPILVYIRTLNMEILFYISLSFAILTILIPIFYWLVIKKIQNKYIEFKSLIITYNALFSNIIIPILSKDEKFHQLLIDSKFDIENFKKLGLNSNLYKDIQSLKNITEGLDHIIEKIKKNESNTDK